MKKLIIIPAYNEAENIVKTVTQIVEKAPDFDYVIINDCSVDNTLQICKENNFNVINLPINLGIGGAVQTGYLYACEKEYDLAVQVDGDGQHDPEFLEEMSSYFKNSDVDMVIGSRFIENSGFQSSAIRRVGIKFFSALIKFLTGEKITDPTSGLRMVGRKGIQLFAREYPKDYPEPETIVAMLKRKFRIIEIPVIMREREGGVSSISMKKSIYYMVKVTMAILIEKIRKY